MHELIVYTRRGCHLCEELIGELMPLIRGRARLHLCDVDRDPALVECYGVRVPVLEADGEVLCEARLDRERVLAWLDQCDPDAENSQPRPTGRL